MRHRLTCYSSVPLGWTISGRIHQVSRQHCSLITTVSYTIRPPNVCSQCLSSTILPTMVNTILAVVSTVRQTGNAHRSPSTPSAPSRIAAHPASSSNSSQVPTSASSSQAKRPASPPRGPSHLSNSRCTNARTAATRGQLKRKTRTCLVRTPPSHLTSIPR